MKHYEVKVFNSEPLEVKASSVETALEKAKLIAKVMGFIIIGISQKLA